MRLPKSVAEQQRRLSFLLELRVVHINTKDMLYIHEGMNTTTARSHRQ